MFPELNLHRIGIKYPGEDKNTAYYQEVADSLCARAGIKPVIVEHNAGALGQADVKNRVVMMSTSQRSPARVGILAHEIGHIKLNSQNYLSNTLVLFGAMFFAGIAYKSKKAAFSLVAMGLCGLNLYLNLKSRQEEKKCDLFSGEITGNPDWLIDALKGFHFKISDLPLVNWFHSHPPTYQRIDDLEELPKSTAPKPRSF